MHHAGQVALYVDLYHFIRLSALGATATLPILGAASARPQVAPRQVAGLLAVATAFHAFAYIHNDVCDLELDRTQPRRAHYPLVRGAIAPRVALAIALACVPLAFGLDRWLVGRSHATGRGRGAHLAHAFLLLAAYNRWGKRCPLPPLTDFVQALGWAALIHYGAAATGKPSRLTQLLVAYEILLIMLVNGLHGALRDLANDAARGAHTTAILFGASVLPGDRLRLPPGLLGYAAALQLALLALPISGVVANLPGYTPAERVVAARAVGGVAAATVALLAAAAHDLGDPIGAGMAHLVLLLSAPVALVAPGMAPRARAALLAAHLLPLLPNGMTYDALRWALGFRMRR